MNSHNSLSLFIKIDISILLQQFRKTKLKIPYQDCKLNIQNYLKSESITYSVESPHKMDHVGIYLNEILNVFSR